MTAGQLPEWTDGEENYAGVPAHPAQLSQLYMSVEDLLDELAYKAADAGRLGFAGTGEPPPARQARPSG